MGIHTDNINLPASGSKYRVAVIGAGVSGLAAARMLADHGHDVTCFDKARGVGGRTSVRRHAGFEFDMGAQYFTARNESFQRQVDAWAQLGVVAQWKGRFVRITESGHLPVDGVRWVGQPGMTALAKHLAESLKVELATTVSRVERKADQLWHLSTIEKTVAGPFDRLVVSIPAAQAKTLLSDCGPVLGRIEPAEMQPCWAVLAGFDRHIDVPYDGALVEHSPLAWIARNNSKPGRGGAEAWVLHASANWSIQNLENSADVVAESLLAEFQRLTSDNTRPSYVHAHRWRYAKASKPLNADAVWSPELGISVCGDWCAGSRVEDAYLSGIAAAKHLLSD